MFFLFPAAITGRFLRGRRREFSNESSSLPQGPVQKLVVADGCWKERRWNDRWLEAHSDSPTSDIPTEICYYTQDRSNLIHRILSQDILSIQEIEDAQLLETMDRSLSFKAAKFSAGEISPPFNNLQPTLRSLVVNHREDFQEIQFSFLIKPNSHGDEYLFKTRSAEELRTWVDAIRKMIVASVPARSTPVSKFVAQARFLYQSKIFQVGVALMININFAVNIFETQSNPAAGSYEGQILVTFDLVLSILFAVELCINFVTTASLHEFLSDYWNW